MTFSDTEMMELGRKHPTNIHNTRLLIRTLKNALEILQIEEAFMVEAYKHTYVTTMLVKRLSQVTYRLITWLYSVVHNVAVLSNVAFL